MGHEVLGNHSPAISALFAFGITLEFLSYCPLRLDIVMHRNCPWIYFSGIGKNKGFRIYIPPVASLILHEITDQLEETDIEMALNPPCYIFD